MMIDSFISEAVLLLFASLMRPDTKPEIIQARATMMRPIQA